MIKNDISIIIAQDLHEGCLVYVEQLPHISASGASVAEANAKLMAELRRYEQDTYSTYNVVEYKHTSTAYKS